MKSKTKMWDCDHCGHSWANRKGKKPEVCPNCHTYNNIREREMAEA